MPTDQFPANPSKGKQDDPIIDRSKQPTIEEREEFEKRNKLNGTSENKVQTTLPINQDANPQESTWPKAPARTNIVSPSPLITKEAKLERLKRSVGRFFMTGEERIAKTQVQENKEKNENKNENKNESSETYSSRLS